MKQEEHIIQIRQHDIHQADAAFAEFMKLTEDCFNERSSSTPTLYKNISPSELEVVTVNLLKEVSSSTPFRAEEIKLVAGHSFPDIMAETYYGVEVKSTNKDKWTSTGSSIVESTRDQFVENIYMLFGKLGGNPPQFRCRPYQDCLSNIAVTHSPRYMIDMELKDKSEQSIFEKINVPYNEFCHREDRIDVVRNYYLSQALRRNEMPWWVGKDTTKENKPIPDIRLMNSISAQERNCLKAQMFILFPQVINGNYNQAALWLCTCRYLLCLNLRDLFSAGGQWKSINGKKLETPLPAVLGHLKDVMPLVIKYLSPKSELEFCDFNRPLLNAQNRFETWFNQVKREFESKFGEEKIKLNDLRLDFKDILTNTDKYILRH